MRRFLLSLLLIIGSLPLMAQLNISPEVGVNVTNYKDYGAKIGFRFGAEVSYKLKGEFSLKSGLFYVRRGMPINTFYEIYGTSLNMAGKPDRTSIYLDMRNGYSKSPYDYIYGLNDFKMEGIHSNRAKEFRDYLQLPFMLAYEFKFADDVNLQLAAGPYIAIGLFGKRTIEESDYPLNGRLPYHSKVKYGVFSDDMASMFDYGLAFDVKLNVKRLYLKLSYDMGLGKIYKGYVNGVGLNYHTLNVACGYRL